MEIIEENILRQCSLVQSTESGEIKQCVTRSSTPIADYTGKSTTHYNRDGCFYFPKIIGSELYKEYRAFDKSCSNTFEHIIFTFGLFLAIISHSKILYDAKKNSFFRMAWILTVFDLILLAIFLSLHYFKSCIKNSNRRLFRIVRKFQSSCFCLHIENILNVSITFVCGSILYGRVKQGQCEAIGNFWNNQRCFLYICVLCINIYLYIHE